MSRWITLVCGGCGHKAITEPAALDRLRELTGREQPCTKCGGRLAAGPDTAHTEELP